MIEPSSPSATANWPDLPSGLSELAAHYDVVLCDIWGVVHDGRRAFTPSVDALSRFRAGGGTVVLITNAPRPHRPVVEQLAEFGVPPDAYDAIVTSGDVTMAAIAARGTDTLYHIGPRRDRALFEAVERTTGLAPRLTELDEASYVVVTGLFDDQTETPADYAVSLAEMRRRGMTMICANPDIVVHVGSKLLYCGGALAEAYGGVGGDTIYAGKPHAPIYEAALKIAAERRGGAVERSRVLAIGDGLRTDLLGAFGQDLDVLFITSGIHRAELHPEGDDLFDRLAYADRVAKLAGHPLAALPRLVW